MDDIDGADAAIEAGIGGAIRAARLAAGLSVTALAERCGISQPHLSQLEAGKSLPSISTLYKLAAALGVSPQGLLPDLDDEVVVIRQGSAPASTVEDRSDAAVARVILGSPDRMLQVQEVSVSVDQDLGGFFEHDGEELLYVLEGAVDVELGRRAPIGLEAGDAVWYLASTPHRWVRTGDGPARLLVVSSSLPARRPHA